MLIIGAQKSGTTWVYQTLRRHPDIFLPSKVELHHFNNSLNQTDEQFRLYLKNFAAADGQLIVGEKTPSYFWTYDPNSPAPNPSPRFNHHIPETVKRFLGQEVKLIVTLRHPVWRAISAYYHHVSRGRVRPRDRLRKAPPRFGFVDMGFYGRHLRNWLAEFPIGNMHVSIMEETILARPEQYYAEICDFLGVRPIPYVEVRVDRANEGAATRIDASGICSDEYPDHLVDHDDLEFLLGIFREDRAELESILGRRLEIWAEQDEAIRGFIARAKVPSKRLPITADKSYVRQAVAAGVDAGPQLGKSANRKSEFEAPCRLTAVRTERPCAVGAFTSIEGGRLRKARIGRYCTIGADVDIGESFAPTSWLSTSPFQYETGFRFRWGAEFPDGERWAAMEPHADHASAGDDYAGQATEIGNDVRIGSGARIVAGVRIGDGAIIAPGAVVAEEVPPYAMVSGVPARVTGYRFDEEVIGKLAKLQWWRYAPWDLAGVDFTDIASAIEEISRRAKLKRILPYFGCVVQFGRGPQLEARKGRGANARPEARRASAPAD